MGLPNDVDLLNTLKVEEKRKLRRYVQHPSLLMEVKCQGCFMTTSFGYTQTAMVCGYCQTLVCLPADSLPRFYRKGD